MEEAVARIGDNHQEEKNHQRIMKENPTFPGIDKQTARAHHSLTYNNESPNMYLPFRAVVSFLFCLVLFSRFM